MKVLRPRYQKSMEMIDEAMKTFKTGMDAIERDYLQRKNAADQKCADMSGKWTAEYQAEYKRDHYPKADEYRQQIQKEQDRARRVTDYSLGRIQKELDEFFNTPVRADFAARITATAASGLKLTNAEFNLLKESANGYSELRLLQALGENRTKKTEGVAINHNTAQPERVELDENDPFFIKLPDPDRVRGRFANFRTSVDGTISFYGGKDCALLEALPPHPHGIRITPELSAGLGTAYFRHTTQGQFVNELERMYSMLPRPYIKTELTPDDVKLIDALIPPKSYEKYQLLIPGRVREICDDNEDLRELFLLDERYRKFVIAREGEE